MVSDDTSAESSEWAWGLERDQLATQYRAQAGALRELLGRKAVVRRHPPTPDGAPASYSALQHGGVVREALAVADERLARMLKTGMFGRRPKSPTFSDWHGDKLTNGVLDGEADLDKLIYNLAAKAGKVADQLDRVRGEQWDREATGSSGTISVDAVARQFLQDVWNRRQMIEAGYTAIAEYDKEKAKARRAAQLTGEPDPE